MNRIICIGNGFIQGDDFGPRVYARLAGGPLPADTEVIDGGIAGLNLLRFFDGCERLVFVDNLAESLPPDEIVVLEDSQLLDSAGAYSHASGLGYLVRADRAIRGESRPQIFLVGAAQQATDRAAAAAVERCLHLALAPLSESC